MEVKGARVHQVLYGDHVLILHLGVNVHPSDHTGAAFPVDQEQLMLRLWGAGVKKTKIQSSSLNHKEFNNTEKGFRNK